MDWLAAGDAYEVALVEGRVAARATSGRAAGRQSKSLPKALRTTRRWSGYAASPSGWSGTRACVAQVDTWTASSLPVPTELVARVWPTGAPAMPFGRLSDPDADRDALVWLSAAVHLAGAERALVRATW